MNPQAPAQELEILAKTDARGAFYHPNCPQALWWGLAQFYPLEATKTPAGGLFLLAEPDRWIALEENMRRVWVEITINAMGVFDQQRYIVRILSRVLAAYDEQPEYCPSPSPSRPTRDKVAWAIEFRAKQIDSYRHADWAAYQSGYNTHHNRNDVWALLLTYNALPVLIQYRNFFQNLRAKESIENRAVPYDQTIAAEYSRQLDIYLWEQMKTFIQEQEIQLK